jgi:hypothetical protein
VPVVPTLQMSDPVLFVTRANRIMRPSGDQSFGIALPESAMSARSSAEPLLGRSNNSETPVRVERKTRRLASGDQVGYETQNAHEQARLLKTLLSNCTFDRGTLCPTYRKPFDLLAQGSETHRRLAPRAGLEPATLRLTVVIRRIDTRRPRTIKIRTLSDLRKAREQLRMSITLHVTASIPLRHKARHSATIQRPSVVKWLPA